LAATGEQNCWKRSANWRTASACSAGQPSGGWLRMQALAKSKIDRSAKVLRRRACAMAQSM
jgi:hypothetical protein